MPMHLLRVIQPQVWPSCLVSDEGAGFGPESTAGIHVSGQRLKMSPTGVCKSPGQSVSSARLLSLRPLPHPTPALCSYWHSLISFWVEAGPVLESDCF